MISTPYLLFLGDAPDQLAAKIAQGIKDWRPDNALGQFRLPGCGADLGITDLTLNEALNAGVKTLVIGVANRGGVISESWRKVLIEALEKGLGAVTYRGKMIDIPIVQKARRVIATDDAIRTSH